MADLVSFRVHDVWSSDRVIVCAIDKNYSKASKGRYSYLKQDIADLKQDIARYSWLNAKVDCTYQSIVFNVILIDNASIRYGAWEKEIKKDYQWSHSFLSPESMSCQSWNSNKGLINTGDFRV